MLLEHQRRLTLGRHQVNKTGRDAIDLVVNSLQGWQELLNTKAAESAAALELGNVQGHFGGLNGVLTGLKLTRGTGADWARLQELRILPAPRTAPATTPAPLSMG